MLGLSFFSKLDCGSYIISIVKTASKATGALIRSLKFLSPEVALYLYKSISWPCLEYAAMSVMSCRMLLVATWIC